MAIGYGPVFLLLKYINLEKGLELEFNMDELVLSLQVEHALPQQFVHSFKDGRFETTPVSHSGG